MMKRRRMMTTLTKKTTTLHLLLWPPLEKTIVATARALRAVATVAVKTIMSWSNQFSRSIWKKNRKKK
jgi:hypothetical protein